ncbi:hypothetical protein [Paenibacillus pedocola]|uniref:hypothetical protein n=1 Tax=Paenibacillus pedocola TaxID=3242193 RepID=UPI002877F73D|nr:hypothetical protein [Paenibacillus typhae]
MKKSLFLLIAICLAGTFIAIRSVHADWAYKFVVNEGKAYIISDIRVEPEQVDSIIGEVTKYSDFEDTYSGNFSNHFPEGTKYYNIKDVNTNEAIAIKLNDGSYIKANYQGEYAGGASFEWANILWSTAGLFMLVIVTFFVIKKKK